MKRNRFNWVPTQASSTEDTHDVNVAGVTHSVTMNKFICISCGKKFKTRNGLQSHKTNSHWIR